MVHEHIPVHRRTEGELLLRCARSHADPEVAQRIGHLLRQEIDWNYLIQKAAWHGLVPLLYWHIRGINRQAVPPDLLDRCEVYFHWNTQRCMLLTGELFKILDLFSNHDIKACPFKGPLLAASLYGNIGLRTFGDLDIVVPRQDIQKAVKVLISSGYMGGAAKERQLGVDTNSDDVDPETIGYLQPHFYSLTRDVSGLGLGNIRVDLQWRISDRHFAFSLDSEKRWSQLTHIPLLDREVPSFPIDDLFLVLCVHGCKHYWYRLKWLCDIAEILRKNETHDWSVCAHMAQKLGVSRMVSLGLFLARTLLDAPVPPTMLQEIEKDSRLISTARWISKRMFAETEGRITERNSFFFYLNMKDNWSDRVRHCLYYARQFLAVIMTPTQKDQAIIRLPSLLYFLYYLIRPLRLSAIYSALAIRRTLNHVTGSKPP